MSNPSFSSSVPVIVNVVGVSEELRGPDRVIFFEHVRTDSSPMASSPDLPENVIL
jgi:hypothetical protein